MMGHQFDLANQGNVLVRIDAQVFTFHPRVKITAADTNKSLTGQFARDCLQECIAGFVKVLTI
jgi:hypothetical protein